MRTTITITAILCALCISAQCIGDRCDISIEAPACTDIPFCTTDCWDDFEASGMTQGVGFGNMSSCHGINYDTWRHFDYTGTGFLRLDIWGGDCYNPEATTSLNNGRNEGWALLLWYGPDCASAQVIWSTQCYWLTDSGPGLITSYLGIGDFDPTRQSWNIIIMDAPPGRYYVQIDGFGWCRGCANFRWCDDYSALGIEFPVQELDTFTIHLQEPKMKKRYDTAGRRLE